MTEPLISVLRAALSDAGNGFTYVVLYTSFGVVRGRTGFNFAQDTAEETGRPIEIIELNEVNVEHYSNHLPTASFDRLYVKLEEVQGFSVGSAATQS